MVSFVIIFAIAVVAYFAARSVFSSVKNGGCPGCSASCGCKGGSCKGCGGSK